MGHTSGFADSPYALLLKLVCAAALGWLAYAAYQAWQLRQGGAAPGVTAAPAHQQTPATALPIETPRMPARPSVPDTPASAAPTAVFRCGNSYSDVPCAGATQVHVAPALTNPDAEKTREIYLCQDRAGARFWQADACSSDGRSIVRIARVSAEIPWAAQVATARHEQQKAQAMAAAQVAPVAPRPVAGIGARGEQCQRLEQRIQWIDSMGRAGSMHYSLEYLREERRKTRDSQFRLGC